MELTPIGTVHRGSAAVEVRIEEAYRPGLLQLDTFSHVIVLWWADRHDNEQDRAWLQTELPYAPGVEAGVFACRAEYRPNPIAITICRIEAVDLDGGVVTVSDIDAYDNSPVLDLKPYIPVADRLETVEVPPWYDGWPNWAPQEGFGLYED